MVDLVSQFFAWLDLASCCYAVIYFEICNAVCLVSQYRSQYKLYIMVVALRHNRQGAPRDLRIYTINTFDYLSLHAQPYQGGAHFSPRKSRPLSTNEWSP